MLYMTDFSIASERPHRTERAFNTIQTGMGSRPNGSNPVSVQCGVMDNPTTQRLIETRH